MKHTGFILLFLLGSLAAAAQTITPDTLMGEWSLRKLSMMGNIADLKTGEVEVSDAYAREKGQSKEALKEQFKKKIPGMYGTLLFLSGNRMDYQIAGKEPSRGTYIILQENNRQYLADEYSGSKMEVYFKDNLLYWEVLGNGGMVIMAWERLPSK